MMLVTAVLAMALTPKLSAAPVLSTDLASIIPKQFGDWKESPSDLLQMDLTAGREGDPTTDNPYDDVLMRTYINTKGQQIMLALAYGKSQKQEIKIHRPELCYIAQGYQVKSIKPINVKVENKVISAKAMLASSNNRSEIVLYWIRIGNIISQNAWQTRFYIFKQGLKGIVADGILVRTSQIMEKDLTESTSIQIQKQFINELTNSLPISQSHLLLPEPDTNTSSSAFKWTLLRQNKTATS
jgi:EpsI family protein